ncbi:MAG: nitrite reductase small subunit NirD [Pseudomonadota bacterium]|jgi:nitrite reductase (NADH) small subunit
MAIAPPWIDVGAESEIPLRGARRVNVGATPVAVFRSGDGAIFALVDRCPHKGGPLSSGMVHGRAVSCPLHNLSISLETGRAAREEDGCARTLSVEVRDGRVLLDLCTLMAEA